MDKPSSFAHKEISIFCFSDDQDWRKFSVLPDWQRWADWEIFQSDSSPDPIKLNPIPSWSANFWKSSVRSSTDPPMQNHVFLFCLMKQKHYWSYFAFSQIWLVEVKIVPGVPVRHEAKHTQPFGDSKI